MIKIERLRFRYIWSIMTRNIYECWHLRTNKCVRTNICKKSVFVVSVRNINICGRIHGLVVPHWVKWRGSAGQIPCPCSTCSTESEDPLVRVPLVPRSSGDPLLPVPLVPTCAICAIWLYHLNLCQLSFLRFFLGFSMWFHFWKNSFDWKFSSKYRRLYNYWRGEINNSRLRLHSK